MTPRFASRWLAQFPFSGACLFALLQRMPALPFSSEAESGVIAGSGATLIRSAAFVLSALGAVHTLAGASTASLVTSASSPLRLNTGQAMTPVAFGVTGTLEAAESWEVAGAFRPAYPFPA